MKVCEDCRRRLPASAFVIVGRPDWGTSARWCAECWTRKVSARSPQVCRRSHPKAARATNGKRSWCWACGVERQVAA